MAYRYGADRIWIVNVGDIKPMEFPIEFFLDYAWNPERRPAESLPEYPQLWAKPKFGEKYAKDIADILTKYTRYNSCRKPELLSPNTYSLINYREAETIVSEYKQLAEKARKIYNSLPAEYRDAFYQLVLHPVEACSNLIDLYVTVGKNHLYEKQDRIATNSLAEKAKALFKKDEAVLPEFEPYNQQINFIEVFNHGKTPFEYPVQVGEPWVKINKVEGKIEIEERLWVNVDWKKAPTGRHRVPITVIGANESQVVIQAIINNPSASKRDEINGIVESNKYVSFEAEHYTQAVEVSPVTWQRIPDLGRTLSASTPFPVTAITQTPEENSPRL